MRLHKVEFVESGITANKTTIDSHLHFIG